MINFNPQTAIGLSPLGQSNIEVFAESLILLAKIHGKVLGRFNEVEFTVVAGTNSTADDLVRHYYIKAKSKTMSH